MPVPIYRYHDEDPWRVLYSTSPDHELGWTRDGIAFHGLASEKGIPVYEYTAEKPKRFMYSTSPDHEAGWKKQDIAFYSLPDTELGAVPVIEYYKEGPYWRFFYSSSPESPVIEDGWTMAGIKLYLLPSNLECNLNVESLDFDPVIDPKISKLAVMDKKKWRNPIPLTEISETIQYTKEVKSSWEFGVKEKLHVGVKTSFKAGLPLAQASTEFRIDFTVEGHQTQKTETTQTYEVKRTVTLKGPEAIEVDAYINCIDDLSSPFTLITRLSAKANEKSLTSSQLMELLKLDGFEGDMKAHSETEIDCILTGIFKGSYGIESVVDVKRIPLGEVTFA